MRLLRILLRTAWIVIAGAAAAGWCIVLVATPIAFYDGYVKRNDPYSGQDRQVAWSFLAILGALSVVIALGVIWPLSRSRRRRMRKQTPLPTIGTDTAEW